MEITPQEIKAKARKLWDSGRVLRNELEDDGLFPWTIPFRKPTAQEWLVDFARLRAWAETLREASEHGAGYGFRLVLREIAHQKLGTQKIPEVIVFDDGQALARFIGFEAERLEFKRLADLLIRAQPLLKRWLIRNPLAMLEHADDWPRLLAVIDWFQRHPRPGRYLRELDIEGVDSKFVEGHRGLLRELLDACLATSAVDSTAVVLGSNGFERRYGLRYDEASVRLRVLDPTLSPAWGITDLALPKREFVRLSPPCRRIFVTENKTNFLSFPAVTGAIVIFGGGYAVEALRDAEWLDGKSLQYWGDIDTHGFAMLAQMRRYWPQTTSLLMDRDTLLGHRRLWVEEPIDRRCLAALPGLDDNEQALFLELREDRLGLRVRLEQERIAYACVRDATQISP